MAKAIASGLVGLGLTLASTFASSLGLTVDQQRAGFVVGIVLMFAGLVSAAISRRSKGERDPVAAPRTGIRASDTAQITARRTRITGQDIGVDVRDRAKVDAEDTSID
jgi:hypothetical protein